MPNWIFTWGLNKFVQWLSDVIKENDTAAITAAHLFIQGSPFMDIARGYAAATDNKDDDTIVSDIMIKPFKLVLPELASSIAGIILPNGDTVGDVLDRVVNKVAE